METTTPEQGAPTGVSRRSVIRAGAHAAWMAPAVTFATAAPAVAASQPGTTKPQLVVSDFYITAVPQQKYYNCGLTVSSEGNVPVEGPITVVVTLPQGTERLATAPSLADVTPGWTASGPEGSNPWTYTFQFGAALTAPTELRWRFVRPAGSTQKGSTVVWSTATASAPNASSGSDTDELV